jgi:hypothetical protein
MNSNPQRDQSKEARAVAAGLTSLANHGPAADLPYAIVRFLDTLGMSSAIPWRPSHEADECPF